MCTKCEQRPRDGESYPKWCNTCRREYKAENKRLREEMQETRGYATGISAMRAYLAKRFAEYGTAGNFTGVEIAHIIRTCTGPVD